MYTTHLNLGFDFKEKTLLFYIISLVSVLNIAIGEKIPYDHDVNSSKIVPIPKYISFFG